ncbi:MAG: hypothetical protein JW801_09315 [Bacteroidales bacterium]|nr:hypothetical protein [Bacteroidales bacterium]
MRSTHPINFFTDHEGMFRYSNARCLILLLLLFRAFPALTQDVNPYTEKIFLHTDRDYYIAGETIKFKAYISSGTEHTIQSRILYIELKDQLQNTVDYLAFLIHQNRVNGELHLPDSLGSGSYILSGFTNWHKNFNNRYAFRKELLLINRFGKALAGPVNSVGNRNALLPLHRNLVLGDSLHYLTLQIPEDQEAEEYHCEIYLRGELVWDRWIRPDSAYSGMLRLDKVILPEGLLKFSIKSKEETIGTAFYSHIKNPLKLLVKTDRPVYETREQVRLVLELEGSYDPAFKADLSVSACSVPDDFPVESFTSITGWFNLYSELTPYPSRNASDTADPQADWVFDELKGFAPVYPIEADGRIISGKVVDKNTGSGVPEALVFFSFMDTLSYLDYDKTDSMGNFFFNIPSGFHCDPGIIQLWDLPEGKENCVISFEDQTEILPPGGSRLAGIPGEELSRIFASQVKVFEIGRLFGGNEPPQEAQSSGINLEAIYSGLNHTVYPANYISLYNFSEITKEILPGVRLRNEAEGFSLQIMDESSNEYFDSPPLVIVNGLPVKNYDFLATLSSNDIEKIDIVRRLFAVGSLIFPGVLSITLKGDLQASHLQNNMLYRVNSEITEPVAPLPVVDQTATFSEHTRRPDLRNTLIWLPDMRMDPENAELRFYTADQSGRYIIRVEGIVNDSIPVSAIHEFSVKTKY